MVYGIVAEYNPFHNGHKYLIEQVKKNDDIVVAVMSGNFVQRGDFAIMTKWERAKTALENGVDLVIELPTPFALKSAEGFAKGAIETLHATSIIDTLVFGAETADDEAIMQTAKKLCDDEANEIIKAEMKSGSSFAAARQKALGISLLETPNNILAVEYAKAIQTIDDCNIAVKSVKRIGTGHDEHKQSEYPSASMIRLTMQDSDSACLMKNCERAVLAKLRTMDMNDFAMIEDVSEGLENRIYEAVKKAKSIDEIYDTIKCKRYAHSRIRRIIMRAYLGIKENDFPYIPYLKILGFNEKGQQALKMMKGKATLPIVCQYADAKAVGGYALECFNRESVFTDLHALGYRQIRDCSAEMTQKVIKV